MIDWGAVARTALHPIQVKIIEAMHDADDKGISPVELARDLDASLGVVSYHVRRLQALKLIRLTTTKPRRGALQHFYVLNTPTEGGR